MAAVEEAPPTEPTGPTEPEPPQTDEPSEDDDASASAAAARDGSHALIEKAERANRNYTKRLREIFGADTTLYDCGHCNGLGVTFEPEAASDVPEDVVHPEDMKTCWVCNGYGEVITGSKHPNYLTAMCDKCSGRGYRIEPVSVAPALLPRAPLPPAPQTMAGQWIPGTGFVPYGSDEPLPNTVGLA